jgi:hypothetical protein
MFELIMTYCLLGQPCVKETVAMFPQWDVGEHICNLAKPGIEMGIRAKVPAGTRVDFECVPERTAAIKPPPNVRFVDAPPLDVIDLLQKVLPK